MAPSEVSVAGSLRTRLALHEPECYGLVPEETVRGTIAVTMLVVIRVAGLADMMGGAAAVVAAAAEGRVYTTNAGWARM